MSTDRQKGMVMLTGTLWEHFVVNIAKIIVLEYISLNRHVFSYCC